MKKFLIAVIALFTGYQAMSQCNAPVVNNFTPNTGFIGSTVTITGAYFETTPANNIVYFGATKATVVTASFGTLTVIVPVGATTAPISVTNSCNKTAYSPVSFNGIFCPTPLTGTTYQNTAQNLTGIYGAYNMVSQDMDLDGKPDVISCTTNGFTVAKNNSTPGTISFSAHNVAGGGSSLFVADLDGDGRREVICPTRVYRNLSTPGTLSFATPITIFGGYQVAAGDFNNDGLIDIVTESSGYMYVLRNTSTGPGVITFASAVNVGYVGTTCTGLQVADVDGDGKTDILGSQGNNNRAVSLRNTTTPLSTSMSFETPEYWSTNGNYPYRCQIADFDKDGKIDLTTCNYNAPANTCIFRNTSVVGDISFATSVNLAAPVNNYRIQVGDVNGDGLPDILTKSLGVNVFSVYPNTSTGPGNVSFGTRYDYTSSAMAEVSGMAIGDLDGDFVPDIATSGISSNTIRFHRNSSSQNDVTPPTANCKNITVALSPTGTVTVTPQMIDNGSSDACGIGSLQINNSASVTFTCANIGANTVTLKVIDRANNQSTCTATVNVAPAAIIVSGQTTVCQGQTVTMSANQGDTYQWYQNGNAISGATNQTYVASQSGNYTVEVTNAGGCSGTSAPTAVTVNNNPTVNITPAGTASLCNGSIALTASTSSIYQWKLNGNNISGATQQSYNATSTGNYSVSVIDLFGCTANSNTVVVNNTPPEIAVSGNSTNIADGDNSPSSTDGTDFGTNGSASRTFTINNSGSGSLVVSSIGITGSGAANFSVSGITLPVTIAANSSTTFTVSYSASTLSTSTAVVTINNNDCDEASFDFAVRGELSCTTPTISGCPQTQYQQIYTSANACTAVFNYTPSINGTPSPSVSYTFSGATTASGSGTGSGSAFNLGQTTVTITASNTCGSATCSFVVTVIDSNKPAVVTQNRTIYLNASGVASITAADVDNGSSDNCGAVSLSLSQTGTICGSATENQSLTLSAPAGAKITSIDFASYGTPSGSCGNFSQGWCHSTSSKSYVESVALNQNSATITASNGNFGDPCVGTVKRLNVQATWTGTGSSNTFNCSKVGNNTVTLIVTDPNGNVSTGTATVTVLDTIKPNALAKNVTVYLNASGNATLAASAVDNGSNDACGIASRTLSQTSFNCSNVGANTVTLTVTDNNGNSSTATATVTVVDNTAPTVATKNITVNLSASGSATIAAADVNNGSSDACGIASVTLSKTSFDCSNVGNNTVTLTVVDNNGNSKTGTATVTVVDNTAPTVTTQNVTVNLSATGSATVSAADINNGSSDACGIASVTLSKTSFDCSNVGNNTVTLTVVDNNGNSNTGTATVTVVDNTAPTVTTQNVTVNLSATGSATVSAADINNGSSDACGIASVTLSKTSFDCSNVGNNTVTLTVVDNNGNSNTGTATVTVVDNTAPTVSTQNVTVNLSATGSATVSATDVNNGSSDACGIASVTLSKTSFDCSNVGNNTVTLTVVDNNGNSNTGTSTVTVVDNTAPSVSTKNVTIYLSATGAASITTSDINNGSSDACGIASLSLSKTSFDCSNVGNNTVTLTVVDNNGNSNTGTATVTVVDNVAPNAVAKNVTVTLSGGTASVTAAQINNGSSDACGIASMSVSPSSFNCSNIGNNTVTLTVVDVNGNSNTATATVNVVGIIPSTTTVTATPSNNTYTGGVPTTIYLGYGPQSATLSSSSATGGSSFSYSWSTASNLNCTSCQSTQFTPTAQGNYTKTVTVTNNYGCTSSASIVMCVIDARSGGSGNNQKVYLCHVPPGNPNNPQTLNISINAVPAHLGNHAGDRLGACNVTCGNLKGEGEAEGELFTFGNDAHLVVYPNPSADLFRFIVESDNSVEPVNVIVYNATGQRMETISNQQNNVEFEVGASLPQGIYFAEVRQGEFKQVVRIVKIR